MRLIFVRWYRNVNHHIRSMFNSKYDVRFVAWCCSLCYDLLFPKWLDRPSLFRLVLADYHLLLSTFTPTCFQCGHYCDGLCGPYTSFVWTGHSTQKRFTGTSNFRHIRHAVSPIQMPGQQLDGSLVLNISWR
jgi:hypothetical protein